MIATSTAGEGREPLAGPGGPAAPSRIKLAACCTPAHPEELYPLLFDTTMPNHKGLSARLWLSPH